MEIKTKEVKIEYEDEGCLYISHNGTGEEIKVCDIESFLAALHGFEKSYKRYTDRLYSSRGL